ncbi:MAG: endonuclease/exonuclease/phosphatase family protein [Actinobacteria bacterium]|nr:endonuclease/exonuclease/phosphatase family protein [Actinomycetota bacterium]
MLVLSWNVNSIRARLSQLLALMLEHEPDVVCVQETRVSQHGFPQDELARAAYRFVHNPGAAALVSRSSTSSPIACLEISAASARRVSQMTLRVT